MRSARLARRVLPEPARNAVRLARAAIEERRLRRSDLRLGLALVYHRVGPRAGDPARELDPSLAVSTLAEHLRFLSARYRVVRASELRSAAAARTPGQPFPVALTFDDDLRSHAELAAPLLERFSLPAAFFLCGASLEGMTAWWSDLQRAVDHGALRPDDLPWVSGELLAAALAREPRALKRLARLIEALPPERRDRIADRLRERASPWPADDHLREEDVRVLVEAGHEIGFHTVNHYDLRTLADTSLERELTGGRDRLIALSGRPLDAIAYPHGKYDARVSAAARRAGFRHGFTGRAEAVAPVADALAMGRLQPLVGTARLAQQLAAALRAAAG